MKALVTGAAGFIGSHLCRRLLDEGAHVIGVDSFADFYPRWIKERNLAPLTADSRFEFHAGDILELALEELLPGVDVLCHLAAQAGVRSSWGENFSVYTRNNIQSTQRLLEAVKGKPLGVFLYASSSSVYGLTPTLPMTETNLLQPLSPYGVTKLAAEQLCFLYFKNYAVPTVSLRFFTVYGPGQRPDMAFHKFFRAISEDRALEIFGDGEQTRDFTYVDDIVDACLSAIRRGRQGEVYNIGGGHRERLSDLFPLFEETCGAKIRIKRSEPQKGDVLHTFADIRKAQRDLDYSPRTDLGEGLRAEWEWIKTLDQPEKSKGLK
ncbi:MAG: NAD-dependent epimerase/dehydratase family protein [Candidatus Aminicenantes bacterium]|nr:NAD-dependent epimerase/dehydratase family protein [Candidatus Aminicenantes bacterium]